MIFYFGVGYTVLLNLLPVLGAIVMAALVSVLTTRPAPDKQRNG